MTQKLHSGTLHETVQAAAESSSDIYCGYFSSRWWLSCRQRYWKLSGWVTKWLRDCVTVQCINEWARFDGEVSAILYRPRWQAMMVAIVSGWIRYVHRCSLSSWCIYCDVNTANRRFDYLTFRRYLAICLMKAKTTGVKGASVVMGIMFICLNISIVMASVAIWSDTVKYNALFAQKQDWCVFHVPMCDAPSHSDRVWNLFFGPPHKTRIIQRRILVALCCI